MNNRLSQFTSYIPLRNVTLILLVSLMVMIVIWLAIQYNQSLSPDVIQAQANLEVSRKTLYENFPSILVSAAYTLVGAAISVGIFVLAISVAVRNLHSTMKEGFSTI